jgi:Kelch motif
MGKGLALSLVLFLLLVSAIVIVEPVNCSGDFWITKKPIPVAMNVYGLAVVNNQIFAFGVDANQKALTYSYNPATDTWIMKKPMPTSREYCIVVAYQDKIYIIGGILGYNHSGAQILTGVNEMYDPAADNWTIKASMPTLRTSMDGILLNGKIYVPSGLVGNVPGPSLTNVTEVYDPSTDNWTTAAPIPTSVFHYASASIGNKIYVVGGETKAGFTSINQIFDTDTNSWSLGKPLPTLTVQAVGSATTGVNSPEGVYVIGGRLNGPINTTQIYDTAKDDWTYGAPFPSTHDYVTEYLAATTLNDTLFIVGGIARANEGFYELIEQYFPAGYNATVSSPSPTTPGPSTSIPEFQPWTSLLMLSLMVAVVGLLVYHKKHKHSSVVD